MQESPGVHTRLIFCYPELDMSNTFNACIFTLKWPIFIGVSKYGPFHLDHVLLTIKIIAQISI